MNEISFQPGSQKDLLQNPGGVPIRNDGASAPALHGSSSLVQCFMRDRQRREISIRRASIGPTVDEKIVISSALDIIHFAADIVSAKCNCAIGKFCR